MVTIYTIYSSPPPPGNWRSFDFTKSGSKLSSSRSRFISFCRRFVYSVQDCRNLRQNKCRKTPPPLRDTYQWREKVRFAYCAASSLISLGNVDQGSAFIFCSVQNCSLTAGISHSGLLYRNRKWEAKDYWESIVPCISLSLVPSHQ